MRRSIKDKKMNASIFIEIKMVTSLKKMMYQRLEDKKS
jgi:hypothetical protein